MALHQICFFPIAVCVTLHLNYLFSSTPSVNIDLNCIARGCATRDEKERLEIGSTQGLPWHKHHKDIPTLPVGL